MPTPPSFSCPISEHITYNLPRNANGHFLDRGMPVCDNPKKRPVKSESFRFISHSSHSAHKMHDRLTAMIIIQSIYCELLKFWENIGSFRETNEKSSIVRQVERIIESRFSESLEANEVAMELNISYSYLSTLLRRELNTNFGDLLLKARIDASKKLLLTTNMSITDIALESGFTDSSYFIKKFRTYTGTTPHKYRINNLNVFV